MTFLYTYNKKKTFKFSLNPAKMYYFIFYTRIETYIRPSFTNLDLKVLLFIQGVSYKFVML